MFLHKSNFLFRAIYPEMTWRIPKSNLGESKVIYLTFDDGYTRSNRICVG
jgi:peptidoglycan/xylan/chitin deacetylase (PgdA/CDA1 family)